MLGFGPEHKLPALVAAVLVVIIGVWAGLGDWSAPAIYGAMFVLALVVVPLVYRAERRRDP